MSFLEQTNVIGILIRLFIYKAFLGFCQHIILAKLLSEQIWAFCYVDCLFCLFTLITIYKINNQRSAYLQWIIFTDIR